MGYIVCEAFMFPLLTYTVASTIPPPDYVEGKHLQLPTPVKDSSWDAVLMGSVMSTL